MYKAVIFDLDDTLYDYQSVHELAMEKLKDFTCERFGIGGREFDSAFSWARKAAKSLLGGTAASHNRMIYCQKMLEHLGRNPVDGALDMYDCYWSAMLSGMKLRDGVMLLLERLRADGVKIAVCTDLTAHIQHRKIRQLDLVPYIDVLVTSEEAGAEKPSEKIYSLVLEKLELEAEDCLFVGDSQEKDVDAPRRLGMSAMLFSDMTELEKKIYGTIA